MNNKLPRMVALFAAAVCAASATSRADALDSVSFSDAPALSLTEDVLRVPSAHPFLLSVGSSEISAQETAIVPLPPAVASGSVMLLGLSALAWRNSARRTV
jgi:hypothetical protein